MCRAQCVLVVALLVGLAHCWDIAVTAGDQLEFYTENGTKTDTVRFPSQNLTALVYDEVHNMLLYVDKQKNNDAICGYNMTSVEYKCYVERNGRNIQGLAFDPVTETLFFTDTKERSINWFSLKHGYKNNVYGNLLIKMDAGIPTDIAVDSCRGYIYWINTNLPKSTIERARFDGSGRKVVMHAEYNVDRREIQSVAIDQQFQKIIWLMPKSISRSYTYSADLNGENTKSIIGWNYGSYLHIIHPNSYTFSKHYLYAVGCTSCPTKIVWKYSKPIIKKRKNIIEVHTAAVVGIAANYKIKDQFQGISDCRHVLNHFETNDSFKIAKEYEGPYCVHGTKVSGLSLCKCTPGYTGDRCEVSVCENYCLHGNCSFTDQGLPTCRCEAGYSGERCEVNVCNDHCVNNGTCSLDEENEPVCDCVGEYEGDRCEVPKDFNNGDGSINKGNQPACQCDGSHEDSGRASTSNHLEEREKSLTLAGLLENWRKLNRFS